MAWLSGWTKRIKLTIDQGDIDSALEDFPVLIHLSTSSGRTPSDVSAVFDELTSNGNRKKIAVTTGEDTECYVEIEKWDDASEEAWLWVKVPNIASGADTILYLYYDSTHGDNDSYVGDTNDAVAENVWDANFKAVYHMRNGVDNEHIYDSTNNNKDGTKRVAGAPAEVAGLIGMAQDFNGSDDYILASQSVGALSSITVEVLINPDSDIVDRASLVCPNDGNTYQKPHWLARDEKKFYAWFSDRIADNSDHWIFATTVNDYSAGSDYYVAVRYTSGGIFEIYVNGVEDTAATTGTFVGMGESIADEIIGRFRTLDTLRPYDGTLDEFRLSNIARTEAWIKATKESLWDDLIAFSAEQNLYAKSVSDGVKLGDTPYGAGIFSKSASDGVQLGDTPSPQTIFQSPASDGVKLGDTPSPQTIFQSAASDGVQLSDTPTKYHTIPVSASDGVKLGDVPAYLGRALKLIVLTCHYRKVELITAHKRLVKVITALYRKIKTITTAGG